MRALLLGGCGFIGSHLAEALCRAGHDVIVYDRSAAPIGVCWHRIRHLRHALSEANALRGALATADVVYHLASSSVPQTSQQNPIADTSTNLTDMIRVLEAMRATDCSRLVYFSSGGTVYGETGSDSVDETHPTKPISTHGAMKLAVEDRILQHEEAFGVQPLIFRIANAYGPRQSKSGVQGFISTCLRNVQTDTAVQLWGDGSAIRDFIHVHDVVALALRAGESNVRSGVFNVGSGKGVSLNDVLRTIRGICGAPVRVEHLPRREYDVRCIILNSNRAAATFGWHASMPINAGIHGLWEHLLIEQREALGTLQDQS